jgi:hypothetical protein
VQIHGLELTPPRNPVLDYRSAVYTCGSCFALNLGSELQSEGFDIQSHPFGIVYSPLPMLRQLQRILDGRLYGKEDLRLENEIWISYDHHSEFAGTDAQQVLARINAALGQSQKALDSAGLLLLTFGSARTFFMAGHENTPVANCHRSPAASFTQAMIDPSEMTAAYLDLFAKLRLRNPALKIVLSVSPVRHLREGLVQNNRSKARLFMLVEALCEQGEDVHYFPAYELLLDVLRDYRWYGDDYAHASPAAVRLICDAFMESCATDETLTFSQRMRQYKRDAFHRPRFPETSAFRAFQTRLEDAKVRLLKDYPVLETRNFFKH